MGELNKRAIIRELLDESGYYDWCVIQPTKADPSSSKPKCILANFTDRRKAELVIPSTWFQDPRRHHAIGALITLAIQTSSPFDWRSATHQFFLFLPPELAQIMDDTIRSRMRLKSTQVS